MPERKYEIPTGDEVDYAEDFSAWLEKGATAKQVLFGDWIADKADLGAYFKTAKEVEAAKLGVQLALKWRMNFQRSAENHEQAETSRQERADAEAARPKRQPKAAATEDEAPARPVRRGKAAAAAPAAKPVGRPARRTAAAKSAETVETPAKPARGGRRAAATAAAPKRPARRGAAAPEADF